MKKLNLLVLLNILIVMVTNCFSTTLDYNFYTNKLILNWPSDNKTYLIQVYNRSYINCTKQEQLISTKTIQHNKEEESLQLPLGIYTVQIKKNNTNFYKQEVAFQLSPKNIKLKWCLSDEAKKYRIYYKYKANKKFVNYVNIDNIDNTTMSLQENYFTKKYMVITALDKIANKESPYSNEIILFIALPPKIKNMHIIN